MIQTKDLCKVGEEISLDLAEKMVKDYHDTNPNGVIGHYIGREILERILEQPDCAGINFYNGINEEGKQTLVYVGGHTDGSILLSYPVIDDNGNITHKQGIVADRSSCPCDYDADHWPWF